MFKTVSEAKAFFTEVKGKAEVDGVESVICAPSRRFRRLVEARKAQRSQSARKTCILKTMAHSQVKSAALC